MAFGVAGGFFNTYLPALIDNLHVGFSRNAKKFAVPNICRIRPVKKPTGQYLFHNPLDYQRFTNGSTNPSDPFLWAPGNRRPDLGGAQLGFEFRPYICKQYSYKTTLSWEADQVADFPFLKSETENLAALAMADRLREVTQLISTSGNYASGNTDTATNWGGGFFSAGTETNPIIKKALLKITQLLNLKSNGAVSMDNLVFVVNPTTAYQMATAQEMHTLFVRSQFAKDLVSRPNAINSNATQFGLPTDLYGIPVVVLDSSWNATLKGSSGDARSYIFPDNFAAVVCVSGNSDAAEGSTDVSSAGLFLYEDMTIDSQTDTFHRLIEIAVTDNRQAIMTSNISGALITNVLS